jgi:hypothetical protein
MAASGATGVGVTIVCVVGGSGPKPSGSTTVVIGVVGEGDVGDVGEVGLVGGVEFSPGEVVAVSVGLVVGVIVVVVSVVSLGRRTFVRGTHV